jgi:hypothetical protein
LFNYPTGSSSSCIDSKANIKEEPILIISNVKEEGERETIKEEPSGSSVNLPAVKKEEDNEVRNRIE